MALKPIKKLKFLKERDQQSIDQYMAQIEKRTKSCIGYPVNTDFNFDELSPLFKHPLNNVGDPLVESTYNLASHALEIEVLSFFADMFRAKPGDWWGYVTNGGSEGNLYSLYLARELYPKAMVYYSEATHYSVQKNIHLLNMPSIIIRSQPSGELDYDDLEHMIKMNRHLPVIVLANLGTTMTEARDDLSKIKTILRTNAVHSSYIHCDGALTGGYASFMEPKPSFDFKDGTDSIAISGHKFLGSPMPCGLVLVKKGHRDRIARTVAYIGSLDTTISGSRNGHSPVFLWYTIKRFGADGLKKRYQDCLDMAKYTLEKLLDLGIAAWSNPNAITVIIPEPTKAIVEKWQLATENGQSHIICMPGITKKEINGFLKDIKSAIKQIPINQ
jgi:histidine decarboxylase